MDNNQIILGKMAVLEDYGDCGDYIGSSLNDTNNIIFELEKRVSELEAILLMVKDIDWKTIRFKERAETF